MKVILFLILSALTFNSFGVSKIKYPFSTIPKDLLTDANVVVRESCVSFKVKSSDETITTYKYAITILNENGDDEGRLYIGYDKSIKIAYLKGSRYDAAGKLDIKLSGSDITDQSAVSGYSLYEDNRMRIADLSCNHYPYTVVFEFEIKKNNTLFYPTWRPLYRKKTSVEHACFTIEFPFETNVRYKEVNIVNKVKKTLSDGTKEYFWEVENLKPVETETYGPPLSKIVPTVYTAPSDFVYDDYEGNMESWQNFGEWINILNEGRAELDETTKARIKRLVSDVSSKEEKIKRIYEHLQENTRYVSIQLGIGGYQPFTAKEVADKGYGDCKALTNYTMAMLQYMGINSYYTLVGAGRNNHSVIADFPSNKFNHAFLCVPVDDDTIWLECTSQTAPFGYLGYFTNDRDVLVINETGGHLVHTPDYKQTDNLQYRTAHVTLDNEGNATATINTLYKGLQYENDDIDQWVNKSRDKQKKWLYNKIDLSGVNIKSFSLTSLNEKIPEVRESLALSVSTYATTSGKRMFLQPNLLNRWDSRPKKIEERKTKIIRRVAYIDADTIFFTLPKGYNVEYKPSGTHIKSQFGEYRSNISLDDNMVTYIRILKMEKGTFPPDTYEQLRDFYKHIIKADNTKVVFVSAK